MTEHPDLRRPFLLALMACLALGVGGASLVGCGDDEEEETTASDDEGTSGGEDERRTELQQPPGTVEPDDGEWDGDPDEPDEPAQQAEAPAAAAEPEEPGESPWGASRADQCRVPERRDMSSSARSRFQEGVRAAAGGNISAARSAFEGALSSDRNAYKAAYNLGVLADRQGQENRALDFYRQALRIQGDYERAAEGIITIHLRRRSVPDALAFIAPLARRYRTNLHLQSLHAEVLVQAERYDAAWDAARLALRCDERFVPALTALVKASLRQGREELAESILEQAIGIEANNAELHFIRGTMLREEAGRLRQAMEEFEAAVRLRPDYAEARMALGIQLLAGGRYPEALTHFEAAATLAPTLVAVHLNLADAYRASKQWEKAKRTFDKVLQMDGNNAQAHFNLGLMFLTAGAEYPGLDELASLQKAQSEFTTYRNLMGPRLPRNDPSEGYLTDLERTIKRTKRRIERDRQRAERDARRAANAAATEGGGEGGEGGGTE